MSGVPEVPPVVVVVVVGAWCCRRLICLLLLLLLLLLLPFLLLLIALLPPRDRRTRAFLCFVGARAGGDVAPAACRAQTGRGSTARAL